MKNNTPVIAKEDLQVAEFDFSEILDSGEMIAGYLEECLDDPNPNVFLRALGHAAKARGMSELAKATGISRVSLYKSFNGQCKPQFETVLKITRAMGFNLSFSANGNGGQAGTAGEKEARRPRKSAKTSAPAKPRRKKAAGKREPVTA